MEQRRKLLRQGAAADKLRTSILFILPALIWYIAVIVIPFLQGIPYSFTNSNGITTDYQYVGLKNYINLFKTPDFFIAFKNTFVFALIMVIGSNLIGLMVALLIHKSSPLNNVCRTLVFMPYVISNLTAAFCWKYIYANAFPALFNLPSPLASKTWALVGVAFISIWRHSGYCMLIYIAALQGVPVEYYEAARVEGAGWGTQFRRITIPQIIPAFSANTMLLLAWGLKVFDSVMAATGGGPGQNSTLTISMYVFNNVFGFSKAGYGQAAAVVMTIVFFLISRGVGGFFRNMEVN